MSTIAMNGMTTLAQMILAAPGAGGASSGSGDLLRSPMVPLMVVMLIFFFFTFTSKRKQDKQREQLLSTMKRGDRVQTIGGILGTIVEVRDNEVVVKVDESNNTKIKFVRSAINRVVTEEDKAESK